MYITFTPCGFIRFVHIVLLRNLKTFFDCVVCICKTNKTTNKHVNRYVCAHEVLSPLQCINIAFKNGVIIIQVICVIKP